MSARISWNTSVRPSKGQRSSKKNVMSFVFLLKCPLAHDIHCQKCLKDPTYAIGSFPFIKSYEVFFVYTGGLLTTYKIDIKSCLLINLYCKYVWLQYNIPKQRIVTFRVNGLQLWSRVQHTLFFTILVMSQLMRAMGGNPKVTNDDEGGHGTHPTMMMSLMNNP